MSLCLCLVAFSASVGVCKMETLEGGRAVLVCICEQKLSPEHLLQGEDFSFRCTCILFIISLTKQVRCSLARLGFRRESKGERERGRESASE